MNWTPEQSQAIYKKDSNILVAAAAGSGKTAVLVERIINKAINENIDIIEKNIRFLNDLKFEDAEGIFEMYPDLFMNFPKKFEEKILKLKDQLGENYVEIIENDTSVVENII